jgi:dienelactone hydrolase
MPNLSLSPSACHARLLGEPPALAYRGGSFAAFRRKLAPKLRDLIGLTRIDTGRPRLAPRVLWHKRHVLGTLTKISFVSESAAHALAYVCLPKHAQPPYRFMICLQGHTTGMHHSVGLNERERGALVVEGDRDFALGCMRRGIAALCLEQRSLGERRERLQERRSFHNDCHDAAMRALMLGRTLLGERVYDVDRALDYLESRGDVDMQRVGVMGNSGGGSVAIYAAALLDRISFAMPSCAFCTFRDSLMTVHHCADNYVPGLYTSADLPDILGLFAPRPIVIVAGRDDRIFPLTGVRRAFRRLREIYAADSAEDRLRLVIGQGGHRFYAEEAWSAASSLLTD